MKDMMVRSQKDDPGFGSGLKTAQDPGGPAGCEEEEERDEERVDLLEPPAVALQLMVEPAGCSTFLLETKTMIS